MKSFTDNKGRQWVLDLNLLAAKRIEASDWSVFGREAPKLMNTKELDIDFFSAVLSNTGQLAFLAFLMTEDPKNNNQDEFLAGISGQAIDDMREAVWAEILDFFRDHRTALQQLIKSYRMMVEKLNQMALDQTDQDKVLQELDKILNRIGGLGVTST